MLKDALKCVTGQLDFAKYAEKQGVANAEAMYVSLGHHFSSLIKSGERD